jgi:AraC-like DNA-binding protein
MKRRSPGRPASEPEFFSPQVAQARRFYLNLQPRRDTPLAVVCGGLEHCTPDYAIDRESFPFHSLEYVVRGGGEVRLRNRSHSLKPGSVFAYGPGVRHRISSLPSPPLVKFFVDFTGSRAAGLLQACHLPQGEASLVYPANILQPLFDELIRAGAEARRETSALCNQLLECLALRLAGARAPRGGEESLAFSTYNQCRQFMEAHFVRLQSLDQLAAERHINKAYLCRLFHRFDHQTPYQYLLRLKMNHAAEQLRSPGRLVKQVAEQAGFADPFHFSRVFRSVLGLSPAQFRNLR